MDRGIHTRIRRPEPGRGRPPRGPRSGCTRTRVPVPGCPGPRNPTLSADTSSLHLADPGAQVPETPSPPRRPPRCASPDPSAGSPARGRNALPSGPRCVESSPHSEYLQRLDAGEERPRGGAGPGRGGAGSPSGGSGLHVARIGPDERLPPSLHPPRTFASSALASLPFPSPPPSSFPPGISMNADQLADVRQLLQRVDDLRGFL